MKVFRLITGGLVALIVVMFVWQNMATFNSSVPFQLDLYIKEHLKWTLKVYTLLLSMGVIGFIAGLVVMLRPYFNVRRLLAQERQDRQEASVEEHKPETEQPPEPDEKNNSAT